MELFASWRAYKITSLVLSMWVVLFTCAAFRHLVFRSTAFDLGIFDQALWQLSQNALPLNSLMRINIFSDHGAFILYLLSLLYRVSASPYLLLAVQSLTLSLGIVPLVMLARYYGLPRHFQLVGAVAYMWHPVVFNSNLFDFHPETIGVPFVPLIVLYSEERRYVRAALVALLVMSCKEVLALTVAALGICLWVKKHRIFGAVLSSVALAWFIFVTHWIMPALPYGTQPHAFLRYAFLGETFVDKLQTILFRPWILLQHLHPIQSVGYVALLIAPYFWCVSRRSAVYLVALSPLIFLNALSSLDLQRSLRLQYSLPLIPILSLMAIERLRTLSALSWISSARRMIAWSVICGIVPLVMGNVRHFGDYPVAWAPLGEISDFTDAVKNVPDGAPVLASARLVPHLSHREIIRLIDSKEHQDVGGVARTLKECDYVVVDGTQVPDAGERAANAVVRDAVIASGSYRVLLERPCVMVFERIVRINSTSPPTAEHQTVLRELPAP